MVLSMPRPYKHKATGVYWYRQRVPAHVMSVAKGQTVSVIVSGTVLRRTVGEALVVTLATKEPAEAKLRASAVQSQFDAIWIAFAKPPERLTLKEVVALAGEAFRGFQAFEDNPGDPEKWRNVLKANAAALKGDPLFIGTVSEKRRASLTARFGPFVDAVLRTHQKRVDSVTYGLLLEHFGKAMTDAADLLLKRAEGDFSPDDRGKKYPQVSRSVRKAAGANRHTLTALLDHKQQTQSQKEDTYDKYRRYLADFAKTIGHEEADKITRDDVITWRDALMARGLSTKTINDQHLAALKSVLAHGVDERGLEQNVAGRVRDKRNAPAPTGPKGYSVEQATTILRATFSGTSKAISTPYQRAIFWVPWICAYTGLRVSEVTQFQGRHLRMEGEKAFFFITPEDGSTKGGNAWITGIHQHLVDLGIVEMFQAIGDGPAFYAPYPAGTLLTSLKNHRSKDSAERVGQWITREVGVPAPNNKPNHAWRHTFTTLSRLYRLDKEARDYMMGSRPTTDAREGYGEWPPQVVSEEVNQIARFDVQDTGWRPSTELTPVVAIRGTTPTKRVRKQPNRRKKAPASTP